jgi:hypothetical protein
VKRSRFRDTERWRANRVEAALTMHELRPLALARDGWRCQGDGVLDGRCSGPLHVHHRKPRGVGGPDELANLVTLCHEHHEGDHGVHGWREHARALASGLLISGFDPAPAEAWGDVEPLPRLGF